MKVCLVLFFTVCKSLWLMSGNELQGSSKLSLKQRWLLKLRYHLLARNVATILEASFGPRKPNPTMLQQWKLAMECFSVKQLTGMTGVLSLTKTKFKALHKRTQQGVSVHKLKHRSDHRIPVQSYKVGDEPPKCGNWQGLHPPFQQTYHVPINTETVGTWITRIRSLYSKEHREQWFE